MRGEAMRRIGGGGGGRRGGEARSRVGGGRGGGGVARPRVRVESMVGLQGRSWWGSGSWLLSTDLSCLCLEEG